MQPMDSVDGLSNPRQKVDNHIIAARSRDHSNYSMYYVAIQHRNIWLLLDPSFAM